MLMSGLLPHGVAAADLYSPISQAHAIMEMSMTCLLCVCMWITQSAQTVSDQPKQLGRRQCLPKKPAVRSAYCTEIDSCCCTGPGGAQGVPH